MIALRFPSDSSLDGKKPALSAKQRDVVRPADCTKEQCCFISVFLKLFSRVSTVADAAPHRVKVLGSDPPAVFCLHVLPEVLQLHPTIQKRRSAGRSE